MYTVSSLKAVSHQSVSDDSLDLGDRDKQTHTKSSIKPAQKPAVSWWQDDEHSGGGAGGGNGDETWVYCFGKCCTYFFVYVIVLSSDL